MHRAPEWPRYFSRDVGKVTAEPNGAPGNEAGGAGKTDTDQQTDHATRGHPTCASAPRGDATFRSFVARRRLSDVEMEVDHWVQSSAFESRLSNERTCGLEPACEIFEGDTSGIADVTAEIDRRHVVSRRLADGQWVLESLGGEVLLSA